MTGPIETVLSAVGLYDLTARVRRYWRRKAKQNKEPELLEPGKYVVSLSSTVGIGPVFGIVTIERKERGTASYTTSYQAVTELGGGPGATWAGELRPQSHNKLSGEYQYRGSKQSGTHDARVLDAGVVRVIIRDDDSPPTHQSGDNYWLKI